MLGLFFTQLLNTYMGSTLRNMHEVLADRADGYIILISQVKDHFVMNTFCDVILTLLGAGQCWTDNLCSTQS